MFQLFVTSKNDCFPGIGQDRGETEHFVSPRVSLLCAAVLSFGRMGVHNGPGASLGI